VAGIQDEAYELLNGHCDTIDELTNELQNKLLKLHREKCNDKTHECEQNFMGMCLITLGAIAGKRRKIRQTVNPTSN